MVVLLLSLSACGDEEPTGAPTMADGFVADVPPLDPEAVQAGRLLYESACAECHGLDRRGSEDWKTRLPSGGYPPPPHDSSGHTWHHSDTVLIEIITAPEQFDLKGMPPSTLSEPEILNVLAYLKSFWTDEERSFQWARTIEDRPR